MLFILLSLICVRPFISCLAYPRENFFFSLASTAILLAYLAIKGKNVSLPRSCRFALLAFLTCLLITVIFSFNTFVSLREANNYLPAILFFFAACAFSQRERKRVLFVILATGLVVALAAIYQYFFGFEHTLYFIEGQKNRNYFTLEYLTRKRAFFPFVTPNALGGYLAMILPLCFIFKKIRWVIVPLAFALLLTKSLGAILSLIFALLMYFIITGSSKKKLILTGCGLLIILSAVFLNRLSARSEHLQPLFSSLMRINYWQQTLQIIQRSPLLGVGPGDFNLPQSRYAHNAYLQIWAEMGIFTLLSFFWLISAGIASAAKRIKELMNKKEALFLLTAYLVFLLHNVIDFTFFLPEVSWYWWIIAGLLAGA
ncbi:MAG: O-antigen ligase family protein [Candidatus Omnitrophica bacterium]|nr:O-antigen ligase family protein [Candidatus Omnitrophota bacterium]MDD5652585.1 O-antigen ligase family protein [Candidatus Omnitrophota bacterium]